MKIFAVVAFLALMFIPGCIVDDLNHALRRNENSNRATENAQLARWILVGNVVVDKTTKEPDIVQRLPGGSEKQVERDTGKLITYRAVSANHREARNIEGYTNALELRLKGWQVEPYMVPIDSTSPMDGPWTVTVVFTDKNGDRYCDRTLMQTARRYEKRNKAY